MRRTKGRQQTIAAGVGNILIGTFSAPPPSGVENKAIIDIHNDSVVAIAPFNQLEKIISVIEQQILLSPSSTEETAKNGESKVDGKTQTQQLQKTKTTTNTKANVVISAEPNRVLPDTSRKNGNEPEPDRTAGAAAGT